MQRQHDVNWPNLGEGYMGVCYPFFQVFCRIEHFQNNTLEKICILYIYEHKNTCMCQCN